MPARARYHSGSLLRRHKALWGVTAVVLLVVAIVIGIVLYRRKQTKATTQPPPTKKTPSPNPTTQCSACKPTDMCVGGVCVNDCRKNNTCDDQDKFCGANDGVCHAKLADGVPCDGSEQCTSGHCVDNGDGKGTTCITPDNNNTSGGGDSGDTSGGGGGGSGTSAPGSKTTNNTSRKGVIIPAVLASLVFFAALAMAYYLRKSGPKGGRGNGKGDEATQAPTPIRDALVQTKKALALNFGLGGTRAGKQGAGASRGSGKGQRAGGKEERGDAKAGEGGDEEKVNIDEGEELANI